MLSLNTMQQEKRRGEELPAVEKPQLPGQELTYVLQIFD